MRLPDLLQRSIKAVVGHYESCYEKYGVSPKGVDWKDKESQYLRFKILTEIGIINGSSVLDVGCGFGDLLDYFKENRIQVDYLGIDLSEKIIKEAIKKHPGYRFKVVNLLEDSSLNENEFDFVIASGLFTVKTDKVTDDEWEWFIKLMTKKFYKICRIGTSFNLMSIFVDYKETHLYYADFSKLLPFFRSLTRYFVIRHDYPLYEYSVYLYKKSKYKY